MKWRPPLRKIPPCIKHGQQEEYIRGITTDTKDVRHVDYGYCPECFCHTYVRVNGESVCPICGLVLEDVTYHGEVHDNTTHNKEKRAEQKYTQDEIQYIKEHSLHLKQRRGSTENWNARQWRNINVYGDMLNVYEVDRVNIYNFIRNESLQGLHVTIEKIIISIMKYLVGKRRYQNPKLGSGIFKELNLTKQEYERVIRFLFIHDDGRYGIVNAEDKHKDYYKWVWCT